MIIKRRWEARYSSRILIREGWYLLGIIPLYVRDLGSRELPHKRKVG
jgi:hypothetical protein